MQDEAVELHRCVLWLCVTVLSVSQCCDAIVATIVISFYRILYMKVCKIVFVSVNRRLGTCIPFGARKQISQLGKPQRRAAEIKEK